MSNTTPEKLLMKRKLSLTSGCAALKQVKPISKSDQNVLLVLLGFLFQLRYKLVKSFEDNYLIIHETLNVTSQA